MEVVTFLNALLAIAPLLEALSVDYSKQDEWSGFCKNGTGQSPVNIEKDAATLDPEMENLIYERLPESFSLEVTNKGFQVQYTLTGNVRPTVSRGRLEGSFTLEFLTFHWPSEHGISGIFYDLEAHFVFYSNRHKNFQEALTDPYGLAIIAVFYNTQELEGARPLDTLVNATEKVSQKAGDKTIIESIVLRDLIPFDNSIFNYKGSVTIPECDEIVNWYLYEKPLPISEEQYKQLTTIFDSSGQLLTQNNRKIQPLNDRSVFYKQEV